MRLIVTVAGLAALPSVLCGCGGSQAPTAAQHVAALYLKAEQSRNCTLLARVSPSDKGYCPPLDPSDWAVPRSAVVDGKADSQTNCEDPYISAKRYPACVIYPMHESQHPGNPEKLHIWLTQSNGRWVVASWAFGTVP
jgi:hypothetical protein